MFVFEPSLDLNGIEHRLVVAVNQRTDPMCTVLHFMTLHFQTPPASDARIPIHQRICHSIRTTETEMPESDVTAWRLPARARPFGHHQRDTAPRYEGLNGKTI